MLTNSNLAPPDLGAGEDFEFKAETRKLLDIVASSLYSDKDVFVREIVSNCSDALEKLRYLQATEQTLVDPELDLEIHITTDVRVIRAIVRDLPSL